MRSNRYYYNDLDIFKSYANEFGISKEQFLLIMRTFNFLLTKSVIDTGKVYKLPNRLGLVYMRKYKSKGKRIVDFNVLTKTGEITYHKNLHSQGYIAKYFWHKTFP